jgi:hypothetical protein
MKDFKPFVISILIVLTLWVLSIFALNAFINEEEAKGQFGDSFGAINALFSGLAFAGIIATILLQRKELILQRKELKLTREELVKSSEAQDKSQKALNLQVSLMTKQAILSAYQSKYSANLELLSSKYGTGDERMKAKNELVELSEKISLIIEEIVQEKNYAQ